MAGGFRVAFACFFAWRWYGACFIFRLVSVRWLFALLLAFCMACLRCCLVPGWCSFICVAWVWFGLGLVNVCFGFQAEPVMGLWCVCVCVCLLWVWSGLGRVWCVCFGFRAEPIMGLRFVFAFGLVGLGLVCVGFGSQAEPIMGPRFVFAFGLVGFGFGLVCVGVFALGSKLNL